MSRVVITGANRGIGFALVQRYVEAGDEVLGLCRTVGKANDLHALAERSHGRLTLGAIDIADLASVNAAAALSDEPVDVLINNAGILGGTDQSLDSVDLAAWLNTLNVMTIGPFRVTRAFIPRLAKARGTVLIVSSQVAASTWPYGGHYAYSSAKAAGNKVSQILAIDLRDKGITVVSVHPGYVRTDMGGPTADIPPSESAAGIFRLAANLTPESSGGFFKWNGQRHPL